MMKDRMEELLNLLEGRNAEGGQTWTETYMQYIAGAGQRNPREYMNPQLHFCFYLSFVSSYQDILIYTEM